ncbi:MAG: type II CRISPR-associated endonuclease Cas1 [Pseudomonadota bacterium]
MADQIVEITQTGHALGKVRGFLEVRGEGKTLGKVPLDDILAIIIAVPGCTISTVLLDDLSQRSVPVVICGRNYLPTTLLLPVLGYGRQFQVMRSQSRVSEPRRKRAWQAIVRGKIRNQATVLERAGQNATRLNRLAQQVKSGDPDNCEAQAARDYWPRLFGPTFRRDRSAPGLNRALNYTYAIVRACVARGISAAGLHPSFSLHHRHPQNPLNLVDDVLEPFRPLADYYLYHHGAARWQEELQAEDKAVLSAITILPVPLAQESSPLSLAAVRVARSLAAYSMGESDELLLPQLPDPLDMAGYGNPA